MNHLSASRKDSVEYASAISVCTRDVVRHTKITPHAFPVAVCSPNQRVTMVRTDPMLLTRMVMIPWRVQVMGP
jgi:hypothetical protein